MLPPKQKRQHPRTPHANVGLVETSAILPRGGLKRICSSLLYDQSKNGLSIISDSPVAQGTRLVLRNRYVGYVGTVRHCQKLDLGFKIGILLTSKTLPPDLRL